MLIIYTKILIYSIHMSAYLVYMHQINIKYKKLNSLDAYTEAMHIYMYAELMLECLKVKQGHDLLPPMLV